jgi:hypothetical protein
MKSSKLIAKLSILALVVFFFQVSTFASAAGDTTKCVNKKECKMECKDKKDSCKKECKDKKDCCKKECKEMKECTKKCANECKMDKKDCSTKNTKCSMSDNKMCSTTKCKSTVKNVKETIDLKKLDANKDGKIFQCTMDVDQLSDAAGKCPKCKMDMKEVTLKNAKASLKKAGFKVK